MPTDRKWGPWSPSDTTEAPEVSTKIETPSSLMDAPKAEPPKVSGMGWQTGMERPKKGQVIAPSPITTYEQYQAALAEHYFGKPPEQVQLEEADLYEFKGEGLEDRVFGWRKNEQTGDFQWHSRAKDDPSAPLTPDPSMVGVDEEGQRKPFEELSEEEQRTRFLEGVQKKLDPDEFEVVNSLFTVGSFPAEYSASEAIEIVLDIEEKLDFDLMNREDLDAITIQDFRKAEISRVISDLAQRIKGLPSATPGETHPPDKSPFDQWGKPIGEEQRYIYYPVGLENVAGKGPPASTMGLPGLLQHFYQYGTLQNVVGLTDTGPHQSGSKKHDWSWYTPSESQKMWAKSAHVQEMLIQADDKTINKFIEDFSESFIFWSSVAYAEADGLDWERVAEKQGRNFMTEPQKRAMHLAKRQEVDQMWALGGNLLTGIQTLYMYHGRSGHFKQEDALKGRDIKDFLDWATKSGYLAEDLPRYNPDDIRPGYYREWMYNNYDRGGLGYAKLFDQLAPYYKPQGSFPTAVSVGNRYWEPRKSGQLGWRSGDQNGKKIPFADERGERLRGSLTDWNKGDKIHPGVNSSLPKGQTLRKGKSEDFSLPPILHAYFAYRQGKDLSTHELGFDRKTLEADTSAYQHALLAFRPQSVTGGFGGPLSPGGMSESRPSRVLAEIHPNEFGGARYRIGTKTPGTQEITRWSKELNEDENEWWDPFGLTSAVFTPEGYIWSGQMAAEIEGAFSAPEGHVQNETMRALIDGAREEIAQEPNTERRVALMRRWLNDSIWRKQYIEGYAERAAFRNARGTIGLSNAMEANVIAPEMVQFAIDAWGNINVVELERALVTKYMDELWLSDYAGLYHTQESMPEDAQERLRNRSIRFARADVARFGTIAIQGGALLIDTDPYGKSEELATLPFYSRIPKSALAPRATVGYGGYNLSDTVMSPHEESAPMGGSVPKRSSTQIQVHELQHQSSLNSFFRLFPTTWMSGMLDHQLAETKNLKDMSAGEKFIQSLIYGTSEGGLTHDQLRERSQDRNWWTEIHGFVSTASPGLALSRAAAMKMAGVETGTDWTLLPEVVWDFATGTFAVGKDYETRLRQVDAIRENEFLAVTGGEMFGQLANALEMSSEQTEWMERAGMVLYFAPEFITGMDPITAPLLMMRGGIKATKATTRFLTYSPRVMRKAVKDLDAAVESGNIDRIKTALKRTQSIIKKNNAPAHQLSIMETAVEAGLSGPYLRAMDRLAGQAIKAEDTAKDAAKAAGVIDDSPVFIPGMDYVNPVRKRVWVSNRTREFIAAGKAPQEAVDLARAEAAEIAKQQTIRAMEITKPGDVYRVSEDGVTTFYVRLQEDGEDIIRPWMHVTEETGEIIQAGAHTVDTPTFKISPRGFVGETDIFLTFDGLGKPVSAEKILGGLKSNHVLFSGVTFDEAGKAIGVGNFVDDLRLVRWNVQGTEYAPRSAPAEVASAYGIPPLVAGADETAATIEQFAPIVGHGPETAGRAAELGRRYHTAQAIVLRIQYEAAMARAGQLSELAESFKSGHGALYKTWTNQREILISLNKEVDELRNTFAALNDTAESTLREFAIARDGLKEVNSILKRIAQGTEGINGKIGSRLSVSELRKAISDRIVALRNWIKEDHLNLDPLVEAGQKGDAVDAIRAELAGHEKRLQEILETAKRLSTKGGMEQYVSAVKQEQAALDAYSKASVKYKELQKAEAAAISRLTEVHITRQAAAQVVFGTEKAIARNVKTIEKNDRLIAISDEIEEARKAGASEERIGRLEMKWNRAVADAMSEGDVAGFYASIPDMEKALSRAAKSAESSAAKIGRSYESVRKLSGSFADETFEIGKIETALKKKWDALHIKNRAEAYSRVVKRTADFLEEGEKALKDAPSLSSDFKSILAGAIVKKPESVSAFRAMLRKIRGFENPPTGMHDGKYIIDANELRVLLETTWGQASIDRIIELISAGGGTRGGEAGDILRRILSKSDEGVPVPGAPTGEVPRGIQIRQQVNDLSEKLKRVQNIRGRAKSPKRIETLDKRIAKLTAQIDELTEEYWTKVVRPESLLDEAAPGPETLAMVLDDIPAGPQALKWGEEKGIKLTTGWNLGGTKEAVFEKLAKEFPEVWELLDDTQKAIFARESQLNSMAHKIETALSKEMEAKDGAKALAETVLPYISDPSQKAIVRHLLSNNLLEDCTVAIHHFDRTGDSLRAAQGHTEVMPLVMTQNMSKQALASVSRGIDDSVRKLNIRGLDPPDLPQVSRPRSGYGHKYPDLTVHQPFSAKTGITPETIVHELLHVATEKILYDAKNTANLGTRLSDATEDLYAIKDILKKILDEQSPGWEIKATQWRGAPSWYQAVLISGVDELLTYGLTNKAFQEFLDGIPLSKVWEKGERGKFAAFKSKKWSRSQWPRSGGSLFSLISDVVRRLIRLPGGKATKLQATGVSETALDEVIRLSGEILDQSPRRIDEFRVRQPAAWAYGEAPPGWSPVIDDGNRLIKTGASPEWVETFPRVPARYVGEARARRAGAHLGQSAGEAWKAQLVAGKAKKKVLDLERDILKAQARYDLLIEGKIPGVQHFGTPDDIHAFSFSERMKEAGALDRKILRMRRELKKLKEAAEEDLVIVSWKRDEASWTDELMDSIDNLDEVDISARLESIDPEITKSLPKTGPRPAPAAGEVPEPFYPRPGAERKFEPVPPPPSVKAGGFDSSIGPNEVALRLEEVRTLEEINGYLHKAWKITHEKASEIAMTEALQLARKDVFNQLFRYETLDNFITRGVKQWAARMDPVRIQVGESSKEVREVFRAARNMSDQVRSDLARLGRMGEEQVLRDMAKQEGLANWATMAANELEDQLEMQLKMKFNLPARRRHIANRVMDEYFIPFLDDVTPIDLDIRVPILPVIARPKLLKTTWANSLGGNKTIWHQARQWLMSDPRMRPGGMKAYTKEYDELLTVIDSTIEKAGALKQNKNLPISEWTIPTTEHRVADHTIKSVQRTLREGSGTSELKLGMRQKFKETGFDPKTWAVASGDELKASKNKDVLRGLLRSFLPHGENLWGFGKAEDALLAETYKILQGENGVSAFKFKESMLDMLSKRRFIPEVGKYFEGFSRASMENARSYAFFSELVGHGAVFQRANELSVKATGGFLSVDEVKAANQILDHQQWSNMQPGDVAKGLAAILNPLGRPFTQSAIKLTKDMERFTNMIRTGEDIAGRGYHMSRSLVDAIDAQLGAVIKELRPLNQGVREPTINAITGALKTWRTSVVTGLIVPRPMYFLNNFAGDVSQVWSELGLAQSSRTNFQLLTGIPWMSKRLYGYRTWMRKRLGTENVLPDLGGSIFNPTIARIFAGEKFTIRTKSGLVVDSQDLLRGAIERGVMDSYANVDLLNKMTQIGKSSRWDALRAMQGWQDDIAETATYVQQRQRFALYCDLIRQGKTEEHAAQKVMDALYDWKNGISEWEARYLNNTIAFYRFWRLAIRQQMRLFMEPLTKPTFGKNGQLMKAIRGETYSARVRQQYIALNQLPEFIDPVVQEDYEETEGLLHELVRIGGLPDWVGHARGVPTLSRVPSSTTEHWMKVRGTARPVTHEFSTTGPFTSIEISTLMADYFQGMAGALIEHLPSTYLGLGDQEWGDDLKMSLNPNWKANFYKMPMEMLHPHQKEFVKSALARFGNQTAAGYTTDELQLKPNESWLIKNTSLLWGLDEDDINVDEFGRETGPAFSLTLWRLFPVVTEFNGLFSRAYFENPEMTQFWETKDMQDFSIGFQSFLGRHTGLTIPGTEIQGQRYPVAAPWPQLSTTSWTSFPDDLSAASGVPAQIARRQYVQQMYTKELFEENEHLIPKSTDLEESIGEAAAKGGISEWATPDMEEAFRIDAERRRLRKQAAESE